MYERMNIEDWKAKKKNDRDAVLADQKQALQEVLQDGADLTAYLLGRGRLGSGITSGNAALVLKACPQATAVMSFTDGTNLGAGSARVPLVFRSWCGPAAILRWVRCMTVPRPTATSPAQRWSCRATSLAKPLRY